MIQELPMLQFLRPDASALVVNGFVPETFGFGSVIVKEGDKADAFFVLASGKARVVKTTPAGEEVSLNIMRTGDSFGEIGLLDANAIRSATVRASSDVEVLRLDKGVFDALLRINPDIRPGFELHIKHRSLNTFFRLHTPFGKLSPAKLSKLLGEFQPINVPKGDLVFKQGDPPGALFIVEDGHLRVFQDDDTGQRHYLNYLRKGDYFGEISVFKGTKRSASVEAVSACKLLSLSPESFRSVLDENPEMRAAMEEHIAQYEYRKIARVPLDFADELLPADVAPKVGLDQVDQVAEEAAREKPFASKEGYFVKKAGKLKKKFPHVMQIDEMDCGAACMAMICRHFGRAISLSKIRQLLFTSTDGTSLKALCRGAEELGLAARSVKASLRNLDQMPLPAIVHWGGNHWVVLYEVAANVVGVADPGVGLRQVPRAEFEKEWTGYAALFDYTSAFEKAQVGKTSAAWLLEFFRPHTRVLAKAVGLALVVSVLEMVIPVFTQVIVDRVLVDRDVGLLKTLFFAMLFVLFFSTIAMVLQRYLLSFVAVRVDAASLDFLTRRLLSLPMTYFNNRRTGDIQRRIQGLRQLRSILIDHAVAGMTSVAQLGTALVLMAIYSPFLTSVFLVTVPLYIILMRFSSKRLRPIFDSLEEAFGKYSSHQIDAIKGIETVKALGAESSLRGLMLGQFQKLADKQFRSDFTIMTYQGSIQTVTFLTTAIFLWAGAHQVLAGTLTVGGLVAFGSLVSLANGPITVLLSLWDQVQLSSVLLNRLNDVFEPEPEQGEDRSRLHRVQTLEGRVRFQNMSFQYGGPESSPILDNVTFDVQPGKMVAIVGRSGSGKTTLIKCLSGLLEPTAGSIFFDGVDMKTLNYRDLRRHVGFVLQENYLFDDTIAKNIAFGEEEPDMDRVLWAARVANAHEFIDRLPLGYETRIGESGIAISGGQKQRVAIARAVYNRPPILVFDEATSALDTESERAVKENMDRVLKGRTSFVIAHRLSTIRDADQILVLEKGRLVEQGTHEELMNRTGLYFYLCSQQLGM
jgi:ATP-binding cassette subfamily B protein